MATFTYRVDADTKEFLKSERFKKYHSSPMDFLRYDFNAILSGYLVGFESERKMLHAFLPNWSIVDVGLMNQKVSIQIDPKLKAALDIQFATNPKIPVFMASLAKFCQWKTISFVAKMNKMKLPKPKLYGRPLKFNDEDNHLTIFMVVKHVNHVTSIWIPALRTKYDNIKSPLDLLNVQVAIQRDIDFLCHGLKPGQAPTDTETFDYQIKDNESLCMQLVDLVPYWNHEK